VSEPRFTVRSISGYGLGSAGRWSTSYWVRDNAYNRVVARFYSPPKTIRGGRIITAERRRQAAEACAAALNALDPDSR
jgi:hypothetical protein